MDSKKIVISASEAEFSQELGNLRDFLQDICRISNTYDLSIEAIGDEQLPGTIAGAQAQQEINEAIRSSDIFIALVGREMSDRIIESFRVAHTQYVETGKPITCAYFLTLPEGSHPSSIISEFLRQLEQQNNVDYHVFAHIDAVKLRLLMELVHLCSKTDALRFENGHATLDGKPVLRLDHVPKYCNHALLRKKKEEKQAVEEECAKISAALDSNPADDNLREQLSSCSERRETLADQISQLEADILRLFVAITIPGRHDHIPTIAEQKANQQLDEGNYEGALAILRDSAKGGKMENDNQLSESDRESVRGRISETLLRITTLKAQGITDATIPEIKACYEEAALLSEKHLENVEVLYEYAVFLCNQGDYVEAIHAGERLENCYRATDASPRKWSDLKELLGLCNSRQKRFTDAEAFYREALQIRRVLAKEVPDYEASVATSCLNLASLLKRGNKTDESIALYREALEIRDRLASQTPGVYDDALASAYDGLASGLQQINKGQEAEPLYRQALKIRRQLSNQDNNANNAANLAAVAYNLGYLLTTLHKEVEAESLCREALAIRRNLAKNNPSKYEQYVASACNNLANTLFHMSKNQEAQELFRESLTIRRRLAARNPDAYNEDVAESCNNLAFVLSQENPGEEAESLYREALDIRRQLAEQEPDVFSGVFATTCSNLARLLMIRDKVEEAEPLFREAVELHRRLATQKPSLYEYWVAADCNSLGLLLKRENRFEEAEKLYRESLSVYRRLSTTDPLRFGVSFCQVCTNLAILLESTNRKTEASELYHEAIDLYKESEQCESVVKYGSGATPAR